MTSGSYIFSIRLLFGLFPLEILFQLSFKGNNPTCRKTFMKFLQQERLGPISCNITLQYRDKMLKGPLQLNFGTRPFPDKMVTRYQPRKKTYFIASILPKYELLRMCHLPCSQSVLYRDYFMHDFSYLTFGFAVITAISYDIHHHQLCYMIITL